MESIDPVQGEWKEESGGSGRGMRRSSVGQGREKGRGRVKEKGGECWEANQRLRR